MKKLLSVALLLSIVFHTHLTAGVPSSPRGDEKSFEPTVPETQASPHIKPSADAVNNSKDSGKLSDNDLVEDFAKLNMEDKHDEKGVAHGLSLTETDLEDMLREAKKQPKYLYNYLYNLYELLHENGLTSKVTPATVASVIRKMKINTEKDLIEKTPLLRCTKKWHESHNFIAEVLCLAGANVNATDREKNTPLHHAAKRGAEKIVAMLIARQASVNATNKNLQTPFHCVAKAGHSSIAVETNWDRIRDMLLHAGANARAKNVWGNTPLHNAAMNEWYDLCWYYRRKHESLFAVKNNCGKKPIDIWPYLGRTFWYPQESIYKSTVWLKTSQK